jgi:TolB-like protein
VWPFENLSDDVNLGYFARGITEEVMVRLGTMHVFVIAPDTQGVREDSALPEFVRRVSEDAPYTLRGTVRYAESRVRITARLNDAASGAQLWTSDYDEDASAAAVFSIQDQIARAVVDSISVVYGPIFDQELARAERKPAENLATYDCVLRYYDYRWTIDPKQHAEVLQCFQAAALREPQYADVWGGLALLYLDEYAFGFTPQDDAVGPLDRAREAARKALDIDGANVLGNFALARARYFVHDYDGFKRSAARLLELDPNNPAVLGSVAGLLAVGGDGDEALPLIEKAIALTPRQAGILHAVRTLIELNTGRADEALAAALRIDAPDWFIGWLLLAAAAGLAEDRDVAQRAVARLLELRPDLETGVRGELDKWLIAKRLHANVLLGLSRAGLNTD